MFDLLEAHESEFVDLCFGDRPSVLSNAEEHIIRLLVQLVLRNWNQASEKKRVN